MKSINIAFDLDGVIIDLIAAFNRVFIKTYKRQPPPFDTITKFDMSEFYGISKKEMYALFPDVFKEMMVSDTYNGARQLFTKLYVMSHEAPTIVTMRHIKVATETYKLVHKIFHPIPVSVILASEHGSKLPYIRKFAYYVEDRKKNAIEIAQTGHTCYLVKRPWNFGVNEPGVIYINSLLELVPVAHQFILPTSGIKQKRENTTNGNKMAA